MKIVNTQMRATKLVLAKWTGLTGEKMGNSTMKTAAEKDMAALQKEQGTAKGSKDFGKVVAAFSLLDSKLAKQFNF